MWGGDSPWNRSMAAKLATWSDVITTPAISLLVTIVVIDRIIGNRERLRTLPDRPQVRLRDEELDSVWAM